MDKVYIDGWNIDWSAIDKVYEEGSNISINKVYIDGHCSGWQLFYEENIIYGLN